MSLWIRCQRKTSVQECSDLRIWTCYSSDVEKAAQKARDAAFANNHSDERFDFADEAMQRVYDNSPLSYSINSVYTGSSYQLGVYSTEARALEILHDIFNTLAMCCINTVYDMPNE